MVTFAQTSYKMLRIESGDGESIETAILFEPSSRAARVGSEYEYVSATYGAEGRDWFRGIHLTRLGGEGLYSHWNIELANGDVASVVFHTSSAIDDE